MCIAVVREGRVRPVKGHFALHNRQRTRVEGDLVVVRGQAGRRDRVAAHVAVLRVVVRVRQLTAENARGFVVDKAAVRDAVVCRRIAIGDGIGICRYRQRFCADCQIRTGIADCVVVACGQRALRDRIGADVLAFRTAQSAGDCVTGLQTFGRVGQVRIGCAVDLRLRVRRNRHGFLIDRNVYRIRRYIIIVVSADDLIVDGVAARIYAGRNHGAVVYSIQAVLHRTARRRPCFNKRLFTAVVRQRLRRRCGCSRVRLVNRQRAVDRRNQIVAYLRCHAGGNRHAVHRCNYIGLRADVRDRASGRHAHCEGMGVTRLQSTGCEAALRQCRAVVGLHRVACRDRYILEPLCREHDVAGNAGVCEIECLTIKLPLLEGIALLCRSSRFSCFAVCRNQLIRRNR